jgi:hypothetical protein
MSLEADRHLVKKFNISCGTQKFIKISPFTQAAGIFKLHYPMHKFPHFLLVADIFTMSLLTSSQAQSIPHLKHYSFQHFFHSISE